MRSLDREGSVGSTPDKTLPLPWSDGCSATAGNSKLRWRSQVYADMSLDGVWTAIAASRNCASHGHRRLMVLLSAEQAPGVEQFVTKVWARHTGLAVGVAIE